MSNPIKPTKTQRFNSIIELLRDGNTSANIEDLITFCKEEIAAIETKAERARIKAAEKRATEEDELADVILQVLNYEDPMTIADVYGCIGGEDLTMSKVQWKLNKLWKLNKVIKSIKIIKDEDSNKKRKYVAYTLA